MLFVQLIRGSHHAHYMYIYMCIICVTVYINTYLTEYLEMKES